MTVATLRALPVNLRNRFGRVMLEELEAMQFEEGDDEIDRAIKAAEAHIASTTMVQEVALLN